MSTGINYLDYSISPIAMRCGFTGCPCRSDCWHLKLCNRFAKNQQMPEELRKAYAGETGPVLVQSRLDQILKIKKPSRIGIQFMGDLFDEQVLMEWQEAVFIHTYRAPHHKYFFLSKQVLNMQKIVTEWFKYRAFGMPKKLHWGISITSQADADRMIPELLRIPGKHWVSIEPFLSGPIDLGLATPCDKNCNEYDYAECPGTNGLCIMQHSLDWIVIGCESGQRRRHMSLEWVNDIRNQCISGSIPLYIKQLSINSKVVHDINLFPKELQVRECG